MKLTIEVDIESIIREEIRDHLEKRAEIFDVAAGKMVKEVVDISAGRAKEPSPFDRETPAKPSEAYAAEEDNVPEPTGPTPKIPVIWEYAAVPGKRRKKDEITLHEAEVKKGRLLTAAEKAEVLGTKDHTDATQQQARDTAATKARIDQLATEAAEAAKAEIAAEEAANTEVMEQAAIDAESEGVVTPEVAKTDDLKDINSLFS